MAVNIKTPVVVENITLMCLRILQKLIKPPAPTSKKNKVLDPEGGAGRQPLRAPASACPASYRPLPTLTHIPLWQVLRGGLGFWEGMCLSRKSRVKQT